MLIREYVQHGSTCDEVTPHGRRSVAVPKLLNAAILIGAAWLCFHDARWRNLVALLVFVAVFLALRDRERFWSIPCTRCRNRRLADLRRTRPTLDGNTEIHIF